MKTVLEITNEIGPKTYYMDSAGEKPIADRVHTIPFYESGLDKTIKKLVTSVDSRDITISYAGFVGLDMILKASPVGGGILMDINSNQKLFWDAFFQLIKECKTPQELLGRFSLDWAADLGLEIRTFIGESSITPALKSYMKDAGVGDWLHDQNVFDKLKALIMEGKIASMVMDVTDVERHEQLAKALQDAGYKVKLIYLSNIPYFIVHDPDNMESVDFYHRNLHGGEEKKCFRSQSKICSDDTVVLEARKQSIRGIDFSLITYGISEVNRRADIGRAGLSF